MTEIRPRRSVLSLPGSDPRLLDEARTLPADAVMLDLEEFVAPEAKRAARDTVAAAVAARRYGHREVLVRVNALDSPHGEADLAAIAGAGPDAIVVPKVNGPDALVAIGSRLRRLGAPQTLRVWAMIESPLAVLHVAEIASAARDVDTRLSGLVIGTNGLAAAGRIRRGVPGRPALMPWLMAVVAAARAYEIDAIDGVLDPAADAAGFRDEAEQARGCGFDGKMLVDPAQIAAANAVFAPNPEEIAHARAVLAAFSAPDVRERGTVAFRGQTMDRSHADEAQRIVALAEAVAARAP